MTVRETERKLFPYPLLPSEMSGPCGNERFRWSPSKKLKRERQKKGMKRECFLPVLSRRLLRNTHEMP